MEKLRFFKGNFENLPAEKIQDAFYYVIDRKQIIINDMVISEGGSGGDSQKYNELLEKINKNAADVVDLNENKISKTELKTINGESLISDGVNTDLKVSGGIDIVNSDEELNTLVRKDGSIAAKVNPKKDSSVKYDLNNIPILTQEEFYLKMEEEYKSNPNANRSDFIFILVRKYGIKINNLKLLMDARHVNTASTPTDMTKYMQMMLLVGETNDVAHIFINDGYYSPTTPDFGMILSNAYMCEDINSQEPSEPTPLFAYDRAGDPVYEVTNMDNVSKKFINNDLYCLMTIQEERQGGIVDKSVVLKSNEWFNKLYDINSKSIIKESVELKTKTGDKWSNSIKVDYDNKIYTDNDILVKDASDNEYYRVFTEKTMPTINGESLVGKKNVTIKNGVGEVNKNFGEIFNCYVEITGTGTHGDVEIYQHKNCADGEYAHAEGYETNAKGNYSHAEGTKTSSSGFASHAEGYETNANGGYSHTEGHYTKAGEKTTTIKEILFNSERNDNHILSYDDYRNMWRDDYYDYYGIFSSVDDTKKEFTDKSYEDLATNQTNYYLKKLWYDGSVASEFKCSITDIKFVIDGDFSHAEGYNTISRGNSSHAEGYGGNSYGDASHAEGSHTTASGAASHAEGYETTTNGGASHAEGSHTTASGESSHAEGQDTQANGKYSHSEGNNTNASGHCSHVEGSGTTANNICEHAQGSYNVSHTGETDDKKTAFSIGNGHSEEHYGDIVEKRKNSVEIMNNGDMYILNVNDYDGVNTNGNTLQDYLLKHGGVGASNLVHGEMFNDYSGNTALGEFSHAEGGAVTSNGIASHAEGSGTTSNGIASHAEGHDTISNGIASHSEGYLTTSNGNYSHAEGKGYIDIKLSFASDYSGNYTYNILDKYMYRYLFMRNMINPDTCDLYVSSDGKSFTITDNDYKFRVGLSDLQVYLPTSNPKYNGNYTMLRIKMKGSVGYSSHASGCATLAKANMSHSEGYLTFANGEASHVEGYGGNSYGYASHAEGYLNIAYRTSHAEGEYTLAYGNGSHVEGYDTISRGFASHAEGDNTVANGDGSHAEGGDTIAGAETNTIDYLVIKSSDGRHQGLYYIPDHDDWALTDIHFIENTMDYPNAFYLCYKENKARISGNYINDELKKDFKSKCQAYYVNYNRENVYFDIDSVYYVYNGSYSHAEGENTISTGRGSHAEGGGTKATNSCSHAEGTFTNAGGDSSHSEGYETKANGKYSHSEGVKSNASGFCAHAEGSGTTANSDMSHTEGYSTTTSGICAHAEGSGTTANGFSSHAEGHMTVAGIINSKINRLYLQNISDKSIKIVSYSTTLKGWPSNSRVENKFKLYRVDKSTGEEYLETYDNINYPRDLFTIGNHIFDEIGEFDYNSGYYSHLRYNIIKADFYSDGNNSHTEGMYTETLNDAEHAEGMCNLSHSGETIDKKTLSSIGFGSYDSSTKVATRKNAFEVMNNGDMYIHGVNGFDGVNVTGNTLQALIASMQQEIKDLKLEIQNLKKP